MTKRHSPTTTGKIERFHRTLRRELLDEAGAFTDIESAQAALDEWVHAYNTVRPHQSLDMATPASLFRARDHPAPPSSAAAPQPSTQQPFQEAHLPAPTRQRSSQAIELDVRVPPSGVIGITGIQQMWIGKNHAGRAVTLWLDLTSIHVIADDVVIKTILSRLTTTDLERLAMRGARPARPTPSSDAVDPSKAVSRPVPIEIDRTASRDGIVVIAHHQLRLGVAAAGTRVTLRIDGGLIHSTAGGILLATLPNPLSRREIASLTNVRAATGTVPGPPPAGAQSVQRRVPKDGKLMVAGQRINVGRAHTGIIVTVLVEDHYFRVLDGTTEFALRARTSTKPIRNFNAHRPRDT